MAEADPFDNEDPNADPFDAPPSGEKITSFLGKLLFITTTAYEDGIVTKFCKPGETKDAVTVDVVVLDPKTAKGEEHKSLNVMQSVLVGKLKRKVGGKATLGRLVKRPSDKGNDAYDLDQPTKEDMDAARKWWKANH